MLRSWTPATAVLSKILSLQRRAEHVSGAFTPCAPLRLYLPVREKHLCRFVARAVSPRARLSGPSPTSSRRHPFSVSRCLGFQGRSSKPQISAIPENPSSARSPSRLRLRINVRAALALDAVARKDALLACTGVQGVGLISRFSTSLKSLIDQRILGIDLRRVPNHELAPGHARARARISVNPAAAVKGLAGTEATETHGNWLQEKVQGHVRK